MQTTVEEVVALLARASTIEDFRERRRLLKRGAFLAGTITPPSNLTQLESLIRGLTAAAKIHEFPDKIRRLRSVLLERRARLTGVTTETVAHAKGRLVTDDASFRLFNPTFASELAGHGAEAPLQRAGKALFVSTSSDGAIRGELRFLRGPLLLEQKEYAKLEDSTAEYVLLCPSSTLVLSGLVEKRPLTLSVAPSQRVLASLHRVGESKLVALVAPTDRAPPNEVDAIEQLEF